MANTIQIMIVDDSEESRQSLKALLDFVDGIEVIAEAKDGAEALHRLSVITPDIVLMDVNMPVMDGVEATERITMQYPGITVIVISVQNDLDDVRRCMRAGAKDFLLKPLTLDVLSSTIDSVFRSERERQNRTAVAVLSDRMTQRSRIITFVSAKGGVGKTTIATSTAAAFAEQGRRVVLVDLDLQFGDASLFFNLSPTRTISDLVRESNDIDPDVLDRYLVEHSSGVTILPSPKRPEEAEYVTAANVRVILQALRRKFDYVVVDTSPLANDVFFAVMETADECFMVSTLNLAILKNNRMLLDLLSEIGYESSAMKHVLNRVNAKNGLKVRDVSRVLKTEVFWEMDNDYQFVETSINEGTPFVLREPHHRLSKQIFAFTSRIDEQQGKVMSRRNPLRRIFASKA